MTRTRGVEALSREVMAGTSGGGGQEETSHPQSLGARGTNGQGGKNHADLMDIQRTWMVGVVKKRPRSDGVTKTGNSTKPSSQTEKNGNLQANTKESTDDMGKKSQGTLVQFN